MNQLGSEDPFLLLHRESDKLQFRTVTVGEITELIESWDHHTAPKKPSLDRSRLGNYRPVSNLSFLSKLIEIRLSRFNLLPDHQSAYRAFQPRPRCYRSPTIFCRRLMREVVAHFFSSICRLPSIRLITACFWLGYETVSACPLPLSNGLSPTCRAEVNRFRWTLSRLLSSLCSSA